MRVSTDFTLYSPLFLAPGEDHEIDEYCIISTRDVNLFALDGRNLDSMCCFKVDIKFVPSFDLVTLVNSLFFTHKFQTSGRQALYFGDVPYVYPGGCHPPRSLDTNHYVYEMFNFISNAFPGLNLNSCLINYYPNSESSIPFHADDEDCIAPRSFIITLSLGATRTLFFKRLGSRNTNQTCLQVNLADGEIIGFSRGSQDFFLHGIPSVKSGGLPRLSATFRSIINK